MADLCPQCGAPIESGDKHCRACGAKLGESEHTVPARTQRTWKSTTAGILTILAAIIGIFLVRLLITYSGWYGEPTEFSPGSTLVVVPESAFGIQLVFGIMAIGGGICALTRKFWGFALVGSICSFICLWPLGLLAIIFTAVSKKEFSPLTNIKL